MMEACTATRQLATAGMRGDPQKLRTDLAIRTHALEKGMSIGDVRYGFGKPKAKSLIADLDHYIAIGGDHRFAGLCCSVIGQYIKYNESGGADMGDVRTLLDGLTTRHGLTTTGKGGIVRLDIGDIRERAAAPFDIFSQSRYSVRDFGTAPICRDDIAAAMKLCERTPTACNRQSQRIHIYTDPDKAQRLLALQLGCNGFRERMQGAILIATDMRSYAFQEINQMYVDGGLYAMNLLYALHYHGIATIPLTMAHKSTHLRRIRRAMNLPSNEQPVLVIGIGSYKDSWKVAQSARYDWRDYTSWDE